VSSVAYVAQRAAYVTEKGGIERCEVSSSGVPRNPCIVVGDVGKNG